MYFTRIHPAQQARTQVGLKYTIALRFSGLVCSLAVAGRCFSGLSVGGVRSNLRCRALLRRHCGGTVNGSDRNRSPKRKGFKAQQEEEICSPQRSALVSLFRIPDKVEYVTLSPPVLFSLSLYTARFFLPRTLKKKRARESRSIDSTRSSARLLRAANPPP